MGKRDPKRVQRRHGERLAHLASEMESRQFSMALETMNRILGDPCLPPETRLDVTLTQVEALLGLNRVLEATLSFSRAITCVNRHGLRHKLGATSALAGKLAEAQANDIGSVGY